MMIDLNRYFKDDLNTEEQEYEKIKHGSHWATDSAHCIRKLYYQYTGVKISDKPKLQAPIRRRRAEWMYERFLTLLDPIKATKYAELYEKTYDELQLPVRFKFDKFIFDDDGKPAGVIILNPGRMITPTIQWQLYSEKIVSQIIPCFHLLPKSVDRIIVIYMRLNSTRYFQTGYEYDWATGTIKAYAPDDKTIKISNMNGYIEKFRLLEQHIKDTTLPEREHKCYIKNGKFAKTHKEGIYIYHSDTTCLRCFYRTKCWIKDGK